jgi:hypothetical protein
VLYLHLDGRGAGAGGTISNDNEFIESFSRRAFHAIAVGGKNRVQTATAKIIGDVFIMQWGSKKEHYFVTAVKPLVPFHCPQPNSQRRTNPSTVTKIMSAP